MDNLNFNLDAKGKFNPFNNFISVKGGTDSFVLENEFNEMQWIQNEARAEIIRNMIPSGIISNISIPEVNPGIPDEGQIFVSSEEDLTVKLGQFRANVNGYLLKINNYNYANNYNKIEIPMNNQNFLAENLFFLEVWFQEITKYDTIGKLGGCFTDEIPNSIIDDRTEDETTRRIQIRWNIRMVQNDENTELNLKDMYAICNEKDPIFKYQIATDLGYVDSGLYIAGQGDESSKKLLGTMDGYSYAIPLFKVLTRNNNIYSVENPYGGNIYIHKKLEFNYPVIMDSICEPNNSFFDYHSNVFTIDNSYKYKDKLIGSNIYISDYKIKRTITAITEDNELTFNEPLNYKEIQFNNDNWAKFDAKTLVFYKDNNNNLCPLYTTSSNPMNLNTLNFSFDDVSMFSTNNKIYFSKSKIENDTTNIIERTITNIVGNIITINDNITLEDLVGYEQIWFYYPNELNIWICDTDRFDDLYCNIIDIGDIYDLRNQVYLNNFNNNFHLWKNLDLLLNNKLETKYVYGQCKEYFGLDKGNSVNAALYTCFDTNEVHYDSNLSNLTINNSGIMSYNNFFNAEQEPGFGVYNIKLTDPQAGLNYGQSVTVDLLLDRKYTDTEDKLVWILYHSSIQKGNVGLFIIKNSNDIVLRYYDDNWIDLMVPITVPRLSEGIPVHIRTIIDAKLRTVFMNINKIKQNLTLLLHDAESHPIFHKYFNLFGIGNIQNVYNGFIGNIHEICIYDGNTNIQPDNIPDDICYAYVKPKFIYYTLNNHLSYPIKKVHKIIVENEKYINSNIIKFMFKYKTGDSLNNNSIKYLITNKNNITIDDFVEEIDTSSYDALANIDKYNYTLVSEASAGYAPYVSLNFDFSHLKLLLGNDNFWNMVSDIKINIMAVFKQYDNALNINYDGIIKFWDTNKKVYVNLDYSDHISLLKIINKSDMTCNILLTTNYATQMVNEKILPTSIKLNYIDLEIDLINDIWINETTDPSVITRLITNDLEPRNITSTGYGPLSGLNTINIFYDYYKYQGIKSMITGNIISNPIYFISDDNSYYLPNKIFKSNYMSATLNSNNITELNKSVVTESVKPNVTIADSTQPIKLGSPDINMQELNNTKNYRIVELINFNIFPSQNINYKNDDILGLDCRCNCNIGGNKQILLNNQDIIFNFDSLNITFMFYNDDFRNNFSKLGIAFLVRDEKSQNIYLAIIVQYMQDSFYEHIFNSQYCTYDFYKLTNNPLIYK